MLCVIFYHIYPRCLALLHLSEQIHLSEPFSVDLGQNRSDNGGCTVVRYIPCEISSVCRMFLN